MHATAKKRTRKPARLRVFRLHPLFLAVGIWYACKGELFLFLLSALVAVQHECAHAFAAAKLGYRLNAVVLMPFGAVLDGDLRGISLKDEIFVAFCGPLCNLLTAVFFVALWWLAPTMYAFTDTACYTSLAIALLNLLPAYPLDGGRIFKCVLTRFFIRFDPHAGKAEKRAEKICRFFTLCFATALFIAFMRQCVLRQPNFTLLAFALFLLFGGIGNRDKSAVYERIDFSCKDVLKRGAEIKRVAVLESCPVKNALRFLSRGNYLVLSVFDEEENHLFDLPQNELSEYFLKAENPYTPLSKLHKQAKKIEKL
ncbi:MAG: hypothetical protein IJV83_05495 [Clostridia bacterium]|nr:hypothetical protein [Clostridia bacterium]MBQ9714757.1 hypothetical protein [Clostridia bacterium]